MKRDASWNMERDRTFICLEYTIIDFVSRHLNQKRLQKAGDERIGNDGRNQKGAAGEYE